MQKINIIKLRKKFREDIMIRTIPSLLLSQCVFFHCIKRHLITKVRPILRSSSSSPSYLEEQQSSIPWAINLFSIWNSFDNPQITAQIYFYRVSQEIYDWGSSRKKMVDWKPKKRLLKFRNPKLTSSHREEKDIISISPWSVQFDTLVIAYQRFKWIPWNIYVRVKK